MERDRADRRRTVALAAVAVALLAALLPLAATWRLLDARLYDVLSTITPPDPSGDIVIVAIDEPSFADLGQRWPWPRSLHARLLTALREAGAGAVGLDLVFAEPSAPEEDAALAAAARPDTVFAADESVISTPQADQIVRTEPLAALVAGGASSGVASVSVDGDGAVRKMSGYPDGFATRVLAAAGEGAPVAPPGALARAIGPARTYPTVSYYQALDPAGMLPPETFRDRIVLVGLSLQTAPTVGEGGTDAFATAWTTWTGRLVAGVEVHAGMIDNLRRGLWIRPVPLALESAAIAAAALLAGLIVLGGARRVAVLAGVGGVAIIIAGSWLLLETAGAWISPAAPVVAWSAVFLVQGARDFAAERRLRRQVTRAFAHYLAPELVDRLARDASALKLGGDRRTLTILFADVRGFTAIAEAMKDQPERLTALVNRVLDPLAAEVLKRGGTIDKFMGDCLMAFWNAPLPIPDHADRAARTALAMVEAVRALDAVLQAEAAAAGEPMPAIRVGVGINTGDCVVGNMGSSARFDYSALGDAVNLASRLEGLSKDYGVPIVVGEATRRALGPGFATATLDRIAVRGRTAAEPVHTLIGPADELDEAARAALADHEALVAARLAGRLDPADPRIAGVVARLPMLAAYHATVTAPARA